MNARAIIDQLRTIPDALFEVNGDDIFTTLAERLSTLQAEVAVHRALGATLRILQGAAPLTGAQTRLCKFMDAVYTPAKDMKKEERFQKLQSFAHEEFILVCISYTPVDLVKMSRNEFDCLLRLVSPFVRRKDFPRRWIFREEFQVSIATKAGLKRAAEFRKGS